MGSFDVGEKMATMTSVITMTGTLASRAEPHQKWLSRAPETMGPRAAPPPAKPAQMAMARARSSGGKMVVISDRVAGITNAAPSPVITRPTMICPAPVATPLMTEPRPKITKPSSRARLRPNRSPRAPAKRRRAANTRA